MTLSVSSNNGRAPTDALSAMPGRNGDGSFQLSPTETVQSYGRIRSLMITAGLGDLLPSDGWSCYRDRAAQQHMRDIGLTTIPVGQSIHGEWTNGGAVDFANLGGFSGTRYRWLRDNGAEHGWYQPGWAQQNGSLPEPWHWEHDQRNDRHAGETGGGFLMALTDQQQAELLARVVNLDQQVTGADGFIPSVAARVINVDRQLTGADGLTPSIGGRVINIDRQVTGADESSPSVASRVIKIEDATVDQPHAERSSWRGAVALVLAVFLGLAYAGSIAYAAATGEDLDPDGAASTLGGALLGALAVYLGGGLYRGSGRHRGD